MKKLDPGAMKVVEIRKIIGKSQSQFAAMLGVSKDTIISVENGRNALSKNLAKRIEIATGANLLEGKLESPFQTARYSLDDFSRWRDKYGQTSDAAALKQFDEMKTWLKVIFLAAGKAGRAGNRHRLPAISLSLAEWLNEARVNFRLEDEIEDVLVNETRGITTMVHSIPSLLENPDQTKKELAQHGIDLSKLKKDLKRHATNGWLFIQDEYRRTWSPGDIPDEVPCRPRRLIPQAKYWIKEFKGSVEALKRCGDSHPELKEYLRKIRSEDVSAR